MSSTHQCSPHVMHVWMDSVLFFHIQHTYITFVSEKPDSKRNLLYCTTITRLRPSKTMNGKPHVQIPHTVLTFQPRFKNHASYEKRLLLCIYHKNFLNHEGTGNNVPSTSNLLCILTYRYIFVCQNILRQTRAARKRSDEMFLLNFVRL